jgi:hypothetical protein
MPIAEQGLKHSDPVYTGPKPGPTRACPDSEPPIRRLAAASNPPPRAVDRSGRRRLVRPYARRGSRPSSIGSALCGSANVRPAAGAASLPRGHVLRDGSAGPRPAHPHAAEPHSRISLLPSWGARCRGYQARCRIGARPPARGLGGAVTVHSAAARRCRAALTAASTVGARACRPDGLGRRCLWLGGTFPPRPPQLRQSLPMYARLEPPFRTVPADGRRSGRPARRSLARRRRSGRSGWAIRAGGAPPTAGGAQNAPPRRKPRGPPVPRGRRLPPASCQFTGMAMATGRPRLRDSFEDCIRVSRGRKSTSRIAMLPRE